MKITNRANKHKLEQHVISQNKKNNGNAAKSDGASLLPGSSEYKEMIRDRMGYDEFEQVKLDQVGRSENIDPKKDDEFHKDLEAHNETVVVKNNYTIKHRQETTAERKYRHQLRKQLLVDDVMAVAMQKVAQTETKADDAVVERRLPKVLLEEVYDDATSEDEMLPGMKVLNKYI